MSLTDNKCDCCNVPLGPGEGAATDGCPDLWCLPCIRKCVELESNAERFGNWVWQGKERYKAMNERLEALMTEVKP